MSLSSASRPNPPSKEAWEAVREEITWLYMSADKTLRDVMNIMRQTRNFIATYAVPAAPSTWSADHCVTVRRCIKRV
jgi:hypothetical protein